ncbi:MAG TPA: hypothetical protein VK730_04140 [Solirubrobacteraceae bacterium]|jgi:hypothetical protein|nr:hypothetical protein [Solirubrobacteraceae bacterium]
MMIEESETPDMPPQSDAAPDVLAARRARRAEAGDPVIARRAEAAEATVRNLETHLAALEQRLEEVGRERERIAQQLMERESDVRGAKQREYAEQQLRVEAEERGERLQREMRGQIQELSNRLEETERDVRELSTELSQLRERDARLTPIVRELMDVAAGLRAGFERELTALREELQQQVVWERETYVRELTAMGARMEDLRFELTRTADDLRAQLNEPIDPALLQHTTEPETEREAIHRREMADALVAAVERLRARVAEVKEAEAEEEQQPAVAVEEPSAVEPEVLAEPVVVAEPEMVEEPQATEQVAVEEPAVAEEPETVSEPVVMEEPVAIEPAVVEQSEAAAPEVIAEPEVMEDLPAVEPVAVDEPVLVAEPEQVAEPEPVEESAAADEPVAVEEPEAIEVLEEPEVLEKPAAADEPEVVAEHEALVEPETAEESPVEERPVADEGPSADEQPRAGGLAAPIAPADRLAPSEPSVPGLGPGDAIAAGAISTEPMALQSRLLTVPDKRISWLAPAIRRLADERDAKLAAELVIELIPAQREAVEGPLNYEIKIRELGTFYVTLDPSQATISREPRGSIDFSLEGPVAAFSELAAGGASRRQRGLRIRKGRRSARRFLKMRRRPIALADLASAGVDVWPGLLLLAMAEAVDPTWTSGRRFELAFDIQGATGIVIYVRVCDGEPILVSRTVAGEPVATISLSGHALICLLAGTQPPPEDRTFVTGDASSVDVFLQWTARAQGLTVAGS